jgi:hypothetical protein
MLLTEHFTLAELTRSETAARLGLDNAPPEAIVANLRYLARVLETVRAGLGHRPIRVTSGYRSPEVNRACGGSATSAHPFGLAADFTVQGVSVRRLCSWIEQNLTGFDQVIYEFGEGGWCHLGLRDNGVPVRQQALTAVKRAGKTIYLPGIAEVA